MLSTHATARAERQNHYDAAGMIHPDQTAEEAGRIFGQFLSILARRHASQLTYDITENGPAAIVPLDEIPAHALSHALVAAIGEYHQWDTRTAGDLAVRLLEEVNLHTESRAVRSILSK